MYIVCYDFTDDKRRSKFAKFIEQYGHRVQYSVYSICNSKRVLNNIITEIEQNYKTNFGKTDHILIISVCVRCRRKIIRYGSAKHELSDVVYF
jgi:CRISPR-associated protein Cas2